MVRYIRYSDKEHVVDEATAELDTIVREARANREVSMVYLRTLEREQELKEEGRIEGREEGRKEGIRATESRYEPILKQKDDLIRQSQEQIGQKDTEITRLKALLAAQDISET